MLSNGGEGDTSSVTSTASHENCELGASLMLIN